MIQLLVYSQKVNGKVYANLQRLENIKRDCMVFLILILQYQALKTCSSLNPNNPAKFISSPPILHIKTLGFKEFRYFAQPEMRSERFRI